MHGANFMIFFCNAFPEEINFSEYQLGGQAEKKKIVMYLQKLGRSSGVKPFARHAPLIADQ